MNYFLHAAVLATVSAAAFGAACSQDGSSYSYTESVTTTANTRTIVTNQCPNHPYHSINSVSPVSTSTTITLPSYPQLKGSSGLNHPGATDQSPSTIEGTAQVSLAAEGAPVGVLFSGAMLSSPYAGSVGADWNTEASGFTTSATYVNGNAFDQCGCSTSSGSSIYQCHVPPSCLLYQLGGWAISPTAHSPQMGWAADGFPVYGPRGPSGVLMQTCTVTGESYGTATCTDDCGGMYNIDSSIDDFYYRYYVQGSYNGGTECTSPSCPSPGAAYYPNTPVCYRGCCPTGVTCSHSIIGACSSTYSNGYSANYTPSATASDGAAGSGTDMSVGLPINTCACACASLTCDASCSSQSWSRAELVNCSQATIGSCPSTGGPTTGAPTENNTAAPTGAPTTGAPTTGAPTTGAPTENNTAAPTAATAAPTAQCPTVAPTTIAPTTRAPTTTSPIYDSMVSPTTTSPIYDSMVSSGSKVSTGITIGIVVAILLSHLQGQAT